MTYIFFYIQSRLFQVLYLSILTFKLIVILYYSKGIWNIVYRAIGIVHNYLVARTPNHLTNSLGCYHTSWNIDTAIQMYIYYG